MPPDYQKKEVGRQSDATADAMLELLLQDSDILHTVFLNIRAPVLADELKKSPQLAEQAARLVLNMRLCKCITLRYFTEPTVAATCDR